MEWPSQSPDLNLIEMLWHDLKQSIHARKPSNVAELKQFCKEEWEDSSTAMWKTLYQLSQMLDCSCCCPGDAQPVIRFRGHLLFHVGPGRFEQPFFLNKWNLYFKNAFCIYSGYLCVILKLVWRSESFKCDKCANGHSGVKKYLIPCWFCTFAHWQRNYQFIILMVGLFEQWETE